MKKIINISTLFAFSLFALIFMAACNDNSSSEEVTLRVTWWGNTTRDQLYQGIIDLFVEENPHITVVTESPGWGDYWTAITSAFGARTAPDVVQFQSGRIGEFSGLNVLTPLDSFVDSSVINLEDWHSDLVDSGRIGDNLYFISVGTTAQTVFVNETYLNELGFELWPKDQDITWEEFGIFLNNVQQAVPVGSFVLDDIAQNNDLIWIWIRQNTPAGVEWVDVDGNFAPSEEALIHWFTYVNNLRRDGVIAPIDLTHEWEQMAWQEGPFVNRQTLFRFANANQIMSFQNATDDHLAIRKVPIAPEAYNAHGDLLISSGFAIPNTSTQQELAAKFIDFFVNTLEGQQIFDFEMGVPGSLAIQDALIPTTAEGNVRQAEYISLVSQNVLPFVPQEPGVSSVVNEMVRVADHVASGMMSPEEAARLIIELAEDLIRQ